VIAATPLTIIGGFLGSGKTTLLNHVLRAPHGLRIVALVNDFGEINIDAELIAKHAGRTISLANGCVCCSIGNRLVEALIDLTRAPDRPDHVLVESSGVADPARIAEIAFLERSFRLAGIVVVVDGERVHDLAQDTFVGDIVLAQIAAADILVLNKIDLTSDVPGTAAWVRGHARRAEVIQASHGVVPIDILLGLDTAVHAEVYARSPSHQEFVACAFTADRPFRMEALRGVLDALPAGILRAKGVLLTDRDPGRPVVLQLVGRRWDLSWELEWNTRPETRLVVVGIKGVVSSERIARSFASALVFRR
jgi:G3E family GTPase